MFYFIIIINIVSCYYYVIVKYQPINLVGLGFFVAFCLSGEVEQRVVRVRNHHFCTFTVILNV